MGRQSAAATAADAAVGAAEEEAVDEALVAQVMEVMGMGRREVVAAIEALGGGKPTADAVITNLLS